MREGNGERKTMNRGKRKSGKDKETRLAGLKSTHIHKLEHDQDEMHHRLWTTNVRFD